MSYLIWRYDNVFIAEGDCHDGYKKAKEGLQLPKAIFIKSQEGEGVGDRDENTAP